MTRSPGRSGSRSASATPRARTGGPRDPQGARSEQRHDWYERFVAQTSYGSHMPLDTDAHWEWSNPLNIIPAFMLLMIGLAALGMLVG